MAQIIVDGGPTTTERTRVGPVGELRHDTSNATLRLHDGATAGGFQLLSKAAADSLYVGATPDLLALRSPGENDLGFLARAGEGSSRYRSLSVAANNLTITNPKRVAKLCSLTRPQFQWERSQVWLPRLPRWSSRCQSDSSCCGRALPRRFRTAGPCATARMGRPTSPIDS